MTDAKNRVCPVERAGKLDNRFRRWLHNPRKILGPHLKEGMTVLDVGCGPGFFTIDIAHLVGKSGRVIAADLQEGMLKKLRDKIQGTELEARVFPHQCQKDRIGVTEPVDFVLAFYMVHEVPDQGQFFKEIAAILKPGGQVLVVEPPFHVSRRAFEETIGIAQKTGFLVGERPKVFFGRAALLRK
jgi:ubiquinone/menaquinone biosynthesis C-methylase UbiE